MKALEFTAQLSESPTLAIPCEIADQLPKFGSARVIVLTDEPSDAAGRIGGPQQQAIADLPSSSYRGPNTESPMKGIEKTPEINGGDACIASTRIPVWVLEEMRRQGATEADILTDFPGLTTTNLADAWAYAKKHPAEINASLCAHVEA
jgi:uncharacterized protein (DUF433 family)